MNLVTRLTVGDRVRLVRLFYGWPQTPATITDIDAYGFGVAQVTLDNGTTMWVAAALLEPTPAKAA